MTDPQKARDSGKLRYIPRTTDNATQLTQRYRSHFLQQGLPAAQAQSRAEFWANLKTSLPDSTVIDPDLSVDDMIMQHRMARGTVDSSSITAASGIRVSAASGLPAGGPPQILERSAGRWLGNQVNVDRYAANPGGDYYSALIPGLSNPPTMFATGDLPIMTASGVDPAMLRWVPWTIRHSAARTPASVRGCLVRSRLG